MRRTIKVLTVITLTLAAVITLPPMAHASALVTQAPFTVDVLTYPQDDRDGRVRISWDMRTVSENWDCLQRGGTLNMTLIIGDTATNTQLYAFDNLTAYSGGVEVSLPAGSYIAGFEPFYCSDDFATNEGGNVYYVEFTFEGCSQQDLDKATVIKLDGAATVTTPSGQRMSLSVGDVLAPKSVIETAQGTRVQLRTCRGATVRIGPLTKVQPNAAVFGITPDPKWRAKLFFGSLWTTVVGLVGGSAQVMPTFCDGCAIGVRGTTFCTVVRGKSMKVQVVDGEISLTGSGGKGTVFVPAGSWSRIVGRGKPSKPQVMTASQVPTEETCGLT